MDETTLDRHINDPRQTILTERNNDNVRKLLKVEDCTGIATKRLLILRRFRNQVKVKTVANKIIIEVDNLWKWITTSNPRHHLQSHLYEAAGRRCQRKQTLQRSQMEEIGVRLDQRSVFTYNDC